MSGTKGQKWPEYKTRRRRIMRFLVATRNKLAREAVFDDELETVKQYDDAIQFMQALNFSPYQDVCPMCKQPMYTVATVDPCCFYGVGEADSETVGKLEIVDISLCYSCGFYTMSGF